MCRWCVFVCIYRHTHTNMHINIKKTLIKSIINKLRILHREVSYTLPVLADIGR